MTARGELVEWNYRGTQDRAFGTVIAARADHVVAVDLALFFHKHHLQGPVRIEFADREMKLRPAKGVPKRLRARHAALLLAYPHLAASPAPATMERLTRIELVFADDGAGNALVQACQVETTAGVLTVSEARTRGLDMKGALGEAAACMALTCDALRDQVVAAHDKRHAQVEDYHGMIAIRDTKIAEMGRLLDAGTRGEFSKHFAAILEEKAQQAHEVALLRSELGRAQERLVLAHTVPLALPAKMPVKEPVPA